MFRILVINPGSTSTKIAVFDDATLKWKKQIQYSPESLKSYETAIDQKQKRMDDILSTIQKHNFDLVSIHAIAARGGPFKPLSGGTYTIDDQVISDILEGRVQAEHISNVAALIAHEIGSELGVPAYFVDPVSVDEMNPLARYSGMPALTRRSLVHALNIKEAGRRYADSIQLKLENLNLIVAHLGGGISIVPLEKGRIIDVNNANEEGPFSPERAGSLPASSLMKLCFSGQYTQKEVKKMIVGEAGLFGYLGSNDLTAIDKRIDEGDTHADEVLRAMAYQIAKEIGAMSTVLKGKVDQIIFTGGAANSGRLIRYIKKSVSFVSPITILAGEFEMEALAGGVLRVLLGKEHPKNYR